MPNGNGGKFWGRKMVTAAVWFVFNGFFVLLQGPLGLEKSLVELLVEKSAWISGLVIAGVAATDAAVTWGKTRCLGTDVKTNPTGQDAGQQPHPVVTDASGR
jgi:hypothetical protein